MNSISGASTHEAITFLQIDDSHVSCTLTVPGASLEITVSITLFDIVIQRIAFNHGDHYVEYDVLDNVYRTSTPPADTDDEWTFDSPTRMYTASHVRVMFNMFIMHVRADCPSLLHVIRPSTIESHRKLKHYIHTMCPEFDCFPEESTAILQHILSQISMSQIVASQIVA
jgi:hypothetical protein